MTADYLAPARLDQAWVATEDGQAVGFIILIPRPGHLLAENVTVLPAAQGRGIGAQLLALAEDRARSFRLPELRLYTNEAMTENLAYYPRRRYTETHRPSRTASTAYTSASASTVDRPGRRPEPCVGYTRRCA